jgi:tetratricopeptide (TPR) repeat protein
MIYGWAGIARGAVKHFKEVVRIDPKCESGHFNLGVAYGILHMHKKAIEAYKNAISLKPDDAEAHYGLGYEYDQIGNKEAALKEVEILKELNKEMAMKLYRMISHKKESY